MAVAVAKATMLDNSFWSMALMTPRDQRDRAREAITQISFVCSDTGLFLAGTGIASWAHLAAS